MKMEIARVVFCVLTLIAHVPAAFAARIHLAPNEADPGGTVDMCAFLSDNTDNIGLQVDLQWDDRCVAPVLAGTGNPQCIGNPATGKSLLTNLLDRRTRILLVALADTKVIPNGQLFCCTFSVSQVPPGATCSFAFAGVVGGLKDGRKPNIAAQGAVLSIRQGDVQAPQAGRGLGAPAGTGGGITIPGANQPGSDAAPQPTPLARQAAPTLAPQPAATSALPGYLPPQPTPVDSAPGAEAPGTFPGAEPRAAPPANDPWSTPTLDVFNATPPVTTTTTASTPTQKADPTATAPPATQTRTAAATQSPGTPTPSK